MFEISPYAEIAADALKYRGIRQDLISGNIANIDTPYYKAKDIDFESMLAKEAKLLEDETPKLSLATTDSMHLKGLEDNTNNAKSYIFFRPNHATRNDGNSVDLDIETTEMSKNSIMVNAVSAALRKRSQVFKAVIDTSSRVS